MAQTQRGAPATPRWVKGLLAIAAAVIGLPILLVVVLILVVALTIGRGGSCEFGPKRDSCRDSDSRMVRASVEVGGSEVARELRRKPGPDRPDGVGNRALPCAAMVGNEAAVKVLLDAGADPDLRGDVGGRPVVAAVSGEGRSGNEPVLDDKTNFQPLDSPHRVAIVQLLAAHGADLESGLSAASEKGLTSGVKALLAAGADPSGAGLGPSPLLSAIFGNHSRVVGLLLAAGADPNHGGLITRDDLEGAVYTAAPAVLGSLGGQASKLPSSGTVQPLAAAALPGLGPVDGRPMLTVLLEAGAKVDALAFGHYTALWVAVATENDDGALLLHQHGALNDPPGGESASQLAYLRGDEKMLAILAS